MLMKEAIHVISCGYGAKTEWGKEVGFFTVIVYATWTYKPDVGHKMRMVQQQQLVVERSEKGDKDKKTCRSRKPKHNPAVSDRMKIEEFFFVERVHATKMQPT